MVVLAIACVYRPSSLSATDSQGENNIRCAIIAGNKDDAYIDGDSYTHTHMRTLLICIIRKLIFVAQCYYVIFLSSLSRGI